MNFKINCDIITIMKWPKSLTFIRHGESDYNALKKKKEGSSEYNEFRRLFENDFGIAQNENWPSQQLILLAKKIWVENRLSVSDYNTPLTKLGRQQAYQTGMSLSKIIELPDIIYTSPYLRTKQTLEELQKAWPELKKIKIVSEDRIREQEHGMATLYNDWRIYFVLNPLQGLLSKLETDYEYRFSNGESKLDVRDRTRSFMATLIRENSEQNVLMISHHITLLSLRSNLERWEREKFIETDRNEKPINCGVTIYQGESQLGKDGKLILKTYNQKFY